MLYLKHWKGSSLQKGSGNFCAPWGSSFMPLLPLFLLPFF